MEHMGMPELNLTGQAEAYTAKDIRDLRKNHGIPDNLPVTKHADGNFYVTTPHGKEEVSKWAETMALAYEDTKEEKEERSKRGHHYD